MPPDRFEVRLSLEKLLIVLIVILVPLNFIGLYLTMQSHSALDQTTGSLLRNIAQSDAIVTRQFIDDRITDVGAIATQPWVVEAILAATHNSIHANEQVKTTKIANIEKQWDAAAADAVVAGILASHASESLRRDRELNPRFLKLILLDADGVPVAATDKPAHYAPVDEAFWQGVSAQGKGTVYVSEVLYDEKNRENYVAIGFPILDASSRRFIGAVHALVDVSSLFALLNREQPGLATTTLLVAGDGTVISAPDITPSMHMKSEEYGAVRDALGTLRGRQAGYAIASTRAGNRIVGFADTGLSESFSTLRWFVIVSQNERGVLAPVRVVEYFAILMVVLGLFMVTLLATYFFLHRKQEMAGIEVPTPDRR